MNQLVQNYKTGEITLEDLPVPAPKSGTILVRNIASVVSVGTEKLMTDLARRSLLRKALARPDLVKRVMDKARTDGVGEALRQAMRRLDAPVPLGYSCSGVVVQVGPDVREVCADQLVACGGHAAASHAEVVRVPRNLCVPVADGVEPEDAAFAFIGAIALHTVRMAQVRIGERVAIIGLGLLGQIAVQIVRAAGAEAFGLDLDESRVRLSLDLGASAGVAVGAGALERALQFTGGSGFDAVLVLASTTGSQPVRMAAELARDQGRIAASGMVRMDMPRDVLYEKELRVIVPRSAGAGIYDAAYEERGVDYPAAYVPWTQQRNMRAFLGLVAAGSVRLSPLITHRFPIGRALDAYRLLSGELREPYLGVVLTYDGDRPACTSQRVEVAHRSPPARGTPRVGVVGAGLFATGVLLPALRKVGGVHLAGVATTSGVSAQHVARKFGFEYSTTNADEVIQAPDTDAVMILTRHGSHFDLARRALAAGKAVFVEKPLATTEAQLRRIEGACASGD
ncbi:MAG: bi-domain-containing oxidoreductase, partial [Armatimonadota bacterium]